MEQEEYIYDAALVDDSVLGSEVADADTLLETDPVEGTLPVDGSVSTQKLADGSVTTAKLADGSVTDAKLDQNGIKSTVNKLSSGGAMIKSPSLTGTPTAPTANLGTNTNQVATTAFVQQELGATRSISVARIHEITGMEG